MSKETVIRGVVKWFSSSRGYGFLTPIEGGPDVFVHFSAIIGHGHDYKSLEGGQNVTYEVIEGAKGSQASNVKTLD